MSRVSVDTFLESLPDSGPDQWRIVLMVGKRSLGKGTDYVLGASHRVVKAVPQAVFVFAGKGQEIDVERPYLYDVGIVPHDRMNELYETAWVVVQYSQGYDSFPRTMLEAMAAGRACIGTTGPGFGMPEQIDDGVTGRLVPPNDPVALAEAIIDVIHDPTRCSIMGVKAYQKLAGRPGALEGLAMMAEGRLPSGEDPNKI